MKKILIVEDEQPIRAVISFNLSRANFEVCEAENAWSARDQMASCQPDLVLLDWMLPDTDGLELLRSWKREPRTRDVPVIMLTAKASEDDRVNGLESGADDYVTKPFSFPELVARINALLRRSGARGLEEVVTVDGLCLDTRSHMVTANEAPVSMGPTEFRLLHYFMSHPERVHSRSQLLDQVWQSKSHVEERTVDVHIRRLRKALEGSGHDRYIQTVRGAGYRFSTRYAAR